MLSFSVVMTVYNDEKKIVACLNEISAQTMKPNEVVIVDGGSKDSTCRLIQEYGCSHINIRLITGGRYTISQGLNMAIKAIQTDYVAIMAVGNHYDPCYLKRIVHKMEENPKADGVYGTVIGTHKNRFERLYSSVFVAFDPGMPTNHGVLMKKSIFHDIGWFCEDFKYAGEDSEFYRRAKKKNKKFVCAQNASIIWEVPKNYKEYFKQSNDYVIGGLQMYTGRMCIRERIRNVGYAGIVALALGLSICRKTRHLGVVLTTVMLLLNIIYCTMTDALHCIGKIMQAFTYTYCVLKNLKYLAKKNKISEEYIIGEVIE